MATPVTKPKTKYRVLDWGAGIDGAPCQISYPVGAKEKHAVTGDVVDDIPAASIGKPGQEDMRSFILGVHLEEVK